MQFPLSTLFWIILVFATSMGLAGAVEAFLAGIVGIPCALYWLALLWLLPRRRDRTSRGFLKFEGLLVLGVVVFFFAVVVPAMPHAGEAARRSQCSNNLKQIGLGLCNYCDKWNRLPPAITADGSGRPLHSWRTLILPHVEQEALFAKFDLKLAWEEGANASLARQRLTVYQCPSDGDNASPGGPAWCNYFAVVGPGTAWDTGAKLPPPPVSSKSPGSSPSQDGTRIVVVEVSHSGIAWSEPKDLTLDEVIAAADGDDPKSALPRSEHPGQFLALLADGSTRTLPNGLSRDAWKTLFTQGFTLEVERELNNGELARSAEHQRQWQRKVRVMWAAFAAWLASVVGFGRHAYRVRSASPAATVEPSDAPPGGYPGSSAAKVVQAILLTAAALAILFGIVWLFCIL